MFNFISHRGPEKLSSDLFLLLSLSLLLFQPRFFKVSHKCQNYSLLKHFAQKKHLRIMSLLYMYMQFRVFWAFTNLLPVIYCNHVEQCNLNCKILETNMYHCLQNCRISWQERSVYKFHVWFFLFFFPSVDLNVSAFYIFLLLIVFPGGMYFIFKKIHVAFDKKK